MRDAMVNPGKPVDPQSRAQSLVARAVMLGKSIADVRSRLHNLKYAMFGAEPENASERPSANLTQSGFFPRMEQELEQQQDAIGDLHQLLSELEQRWHQEPDTNAKGLSAGIGR